MPTKAGERVKFETGTAGVVVTKGGDGAIDFDPSGAGALQVGKRYTDEASGIEVLVTKPGAGALKVNGAEMAQVQPKQTKSAD